MPDANHIDVSVGAEHACAVRDDGAVACWGANRGGSTVVPDDLEPAIAVASDRTDNCVVGVSGGIRCFGARDLVAPTGSSYVDVALGNALVCGIDASGRADCIANPVTDASADSNADIVAAARAAEAAGPYVAFDIGTRFAGTVGCGVGSDGALACFVGADGLTLPGASAGPDFVPEPTASVYSDTTAELFWERPADFRLDLSIVGFEVLRVEAGPGGADECR